MMYEDDHNNNRIHVTDVGSDTNQEIYFTSIVVSGISFRNKTGVSKETGGPHQPLFSQGEIVYGLFAALMAFSLNAFSFVWCSSEKYSSCVM
jgi:hypothetical protein